MTSKSHFLFLVVLACAGSLGLVALRADDGQQGGNINGTESLGLEVTMTPTAAAPAGSSIKASLEADDEDGVTQAKLKLESQGLAAGTYSVSVTLKSDGSTVPLGTFTVTATPTPTPTPTPDNQHRGNTTVLPPPQLDPPASLAPTLTNTPCGNQKNKKLNFDSMNHF